MDWLTSFHLVHAHALHRHHASIYVRDQIPGAVAEDADIPDLSSRVGIEGSVMEHDLAFFSRLKLGHTLTVFHDRQNFAIVGDGLFVTFEDGLAQIAVDRTGGLFCSALPRSASALALLLHRVIESGLIEFNSLIASCIDHEVELKPKSVVQLKCLFP